MEQTIKCVGVWHKEYRLFFGGKRLFKVDDELNVLE